MNLTFFEKGFFTHDSNIHTLYKRRANQVIETTGSASDIIGASFFPIRKMASNASFVPSKASQQSAEVAPKLFDKTWEVIQKKSKLSCPLLEALDLLFTRASLYQLDQQQAGMSCMK
jgi:hypothetical protein